MSAAQRLSEIEDAQLCVVQGETMPVVGNDTERTMKQRAELRATVSLVARYGVVDGKTLFEGVGTNLSPTGMFIGTRRPLNEGSVLRIECEPYDRDGLIRGTARVIWSRKTADGENRPAGMGLVFVDLEPEARDLIGEMQRVGDAGSAGPEARADAGDDGASATAPEVDDEAPVSGVIERPSGFEAEPDVDQAVRVSRLSALLEANATEDASDVDVDDAQLAPVFRIAPVLWTIAALVLVGAGSWYAVHLHSTSVQPTPSAQVEGP